MNEKELIAKQQLDIEVFKKTLALYEEAAKEIILKIVCIGGPLNDNKLQYNFKQRIIFHSIVKKLEDLIDE